MKIGISITALATLTFLFPGAAPAAGPRHLKVGECSITTIDMLGGRIEDIPDSGSYVSFADGRQQVSYTIVPAIKQSRVGDPVRVCLQSYPTDCQKGDARGIVYTTRNLRTGLAWTMPDSQHMCGGA